MAVRRIRNHGWRTLAAPLSLIFFTGVCALTAHGQGIGVFTSGSAFFSFDPDSLTGVGNVSRAVSWIPESSEVNGFQLNETYTQGNASASAKAAIYHSDGNPFGLGWPAQTGVSHTDTANPTLVSSAMLTINWSGSWTMVGGNVGPVASGWANFPSILGNVASGEGSYVRFQLDGSFGGNSTRSPIHFDTGTITTPGAFSTSFFSSEALDPNFIPEGASEVLSGTMTFWARGIDGTSSIALGAPASAVPEPREWFAIVGVGLMAFVGLRHVRSSAPASAPAT